MNPFCFQSSCIPGILQQLQVSMVAHNGCLRNLSLWFICASQVVGKLIFKSVVEKQNSTLIYHTLPLSQLWQTETWQLRSCQLESCSCSVPWMNTSHCWVWQCFFPGHLGRILDSHFIYPFILKCTFWHQLPIQPASLSAEASYLNSVWEVFFGGSGASSGRELWRWCARGGGWRI